MKILIATFLLAVAGLTIFMDGAMLLLEAPGYTGNNTGYRLFLAVYTIIGFLMATSGFTLAIAKALKSHDKPL